MKKLLLKEVYRDYLLEGRKFLDLKKFKSLPKDPQIQQKWLDENGEMLGKGSSRNAWLIDSGKVLKFAFPNSWEKNFSGHLSTASGRAQNQAEVELYTDPHMKDVVAKIYDFAPDYSWIVSELVREVKSESEWKQLAGIKKNAKIPLHFQSLVNTLENVAKYVRDSRNLRPETFNKKIAEEPEFIKTLVKVAANTNLDLRDLTSYHHWGKTGDGRLVILDYGATEEVLEKFYLK